ncbi:methyltransferase type 12 [Candidatus Magnetoovum chiemensis]|nr:methyltransferase type 12 [Candidatus Magnetoovum chiemensis]
MQDIESSDLSESFDYIFICGVFNLKVQGLEDTIRITLKKLFKSCTKALAFNALSAYNPNKDYEYNYIYPDEIFSFTVKNLSPYIVLRHDKLYYDFVMFIYKESNMI